MKRLFTLVLGAATLVAVQGCSKEAALYLGGPAGPIASIALSYSGFNIRVDQSATLGARGEDAVGNPTADAVSFSSCDGSVVSVASGTAPENFTAAATLTGAGMGTSCVNVTAGGLSQEVTVNVGPAALKIVGDPIVSYNADDPTANGPFDFTVAPVDADGNALTGTVPLEWNTSDAGLFMVDHTDGTIVETFSLGSGTLSVSAPGGANDAVTINVAAPEFTGTASANTGDPGDLITLTRAGGGAAFDAGVTAGFGFGGLPAFIDTWTADNLNVVVPTIGVAGRSDLVISDYGPSSLDRRVVFTSTASLLDMFSPGNIDDACNIPSSIPVYENVVSPGNAVYISHDGATQGTGSCLDAGDTGDDHWFTFTTGATGVTDIVATWWLAGDYDLVVCDAAAKVAGNDASCEYGYSGNSYDETMTGVALAANTQYWFAFEVWDGAAGINNVKISITKQ